MSCFGNCEMRKGGWLEPFTASDFPEKEPLSAKAPQSQQSCQKLDFDSLLQYCMLSDDGCTSSPWRLKTFVALLSTCFASLASTFFARKARFGAKIDILEKVHSTRSYAEAPVLINLS